MTVLSLVPTILTAIYVGAIGVVVALGAAHGVVRWAERHAVAAQRGDRRGALDAARALRR
jgi:hypothetical protein